MNFLCQSSSIHFLCNSGFDFNKLFREGKQKYCILEAESYRECLWHSRHSIPKHRRWRNSERRTFNKIWKSKSVRILFQQSSNTWRTSLYYWRCVVCEFQCFLAVMRFIDVFSVSSKIEKFLSPDNEEKEIIFDRCNGFVRKLIFQVSVVFFFFFIFEGV